jgi:uncharacterized protein (TIGR02147 family)
MKYLRLGDLAQTLWAIRPSYCGGKPAHPIINTLMTSLSVLQEFTDYRSFLLAHAQRAKQERSSFSLGHWARRLGLKDTSSLTKILNGDREPGDQMTERLVDYFKFNSREADYFRDLVRLSKIRRDPRLSVALLEKMAKKYPSGSFRQLDEKSFSLLANWFYLPLREMIRFEEFQESSDWINSNLQFHVGARDLRLAVETMLELNLLSRDEKGRLQVTDAQVVTQNDYASEAIKRYHEQMLEHAKLAIRKFSVDEREYQADCIIINTSNIPLAKQMIREFRKKLTESLEEHSGDSVYQLQIQFFPLTKKIRLRGKL